MRQSHQIHKTVTLILYTVYVLGENHLLRREGELEKSVYNYFFRWYTIDV